MPRYYALIKYVQENVTFVHREQHQREPASVLGLHEHPCCSGGLQSAAGQRALGECQGGGHHRPLPSDYAHGPRDLRGATGTTGNIIIIDLLTPTHCRHRLCETFYLKFH